MKSAERAAAQNDEAAVDRELAAWRDEIRRNALVALARRPQKPPRFLRIGALVLLLLMHAILLMGLRDAMRRRPTMTETAVVVTLLDELPEPPLPMPAPAMQHPASVSARVSRMIAPPSAATPVAAPDAAAVSAHVLNSDGSIRLPPEASPAHAPTPLQVSAELMQRGHNILHCRQTRFAGGYTRDESAGDAIARKYLKWIGLYNAEFAEKKAAQREADAAAACDG